MKTYKKIKPFTERGVAKRKELRKDFPEFFINAIEKLKLSPFCKESGEYISNISAINCAHIFPKRTYKSVATNFENIILFSWENHAKFDALLDCLDFERLAVEFPNSWPIVLKQVKSILGNVTECGKLHSKFKNLFELT
jgi:hypothetical protein